MIFAQFGITSVINARGTSTRLSAGPLSDEVAEAMREAAHLGEMPRAALAD